MRDILTALAIVLVLLLTGALVGPHLLDLEGRRPEINARLSAMTGADVAVEGPLSLQLLPVPSVKLGQIRVVSSTGDKAVIGRVRAEASIPSLLRGEIRLTKALVQGGEVALLGKRASGQGDLPDLSALPPLVLDKVEIQSLSVVVPGALGGAPLRFQQIDGTVEAASLAGPFKGNLGFDHEGTRRQLRFSTGRADKDGLRLRALLENEQGAARTDFDGLLSVTPEATIGFSGQLNASGNMDLPAAADGGQMIWRVTGKLSGTPKAITLQPAEVALGSGDRQVQLEATASLELAGPPRASLGLVARRLDLDRLLGEPGSERTLVPSELLARFGASGSPVVALPPFDLSLDLSATALVVGGNIINAPRASGALQQGGWRWRFAEASLPGTTTLSIKEGNRLAVEVGDVARLQSWFTGEAAGSAPVERLKLTGQIEASDKLLRIRNADMQADSMRFQGSVALDRGLPRPKLSLDLTADQLDVAKLPNFGGRGDESRADIALRLDARNVRYAGVGAGGIRLVAQQQDGTLLIEDFVASGIDGANLSAKGSWGPARRDMSMSVTASRLEGLLAMAERFGLGDALQPVAQRADRLVPLSLAVKGSDAARGPATVGGHGFDLAVDGSLAGTVVKGQMGLMETGGLRPGALDLTIENPSAAVVTAQVGLPTDSAVRAGPLRLRLQSLPPEAPPARARWSLTGQMAGVDIAMQGRETGHNETPFVGDLKLDSRDLAPFASLLRIAVPAVPRGQSFRLTSGVTFRNYKITLTDLALASGQQAVKGEIAFNLLEFGRVAGQLRTGPLEASGVQSLIFGPASSGPGWSTARFGEAARMTLPGDLWIEAESLKLFDGTIVQEPKFVFRFENGIIYVEHGRGRWAGGRFEGQATLRRTGGNVSVSGRSTFNDLDLAALPGASGLAGRGSGQIEFSALGESPRALVNAFAGTGRAEVRGATALSLPQNALPRLVERMAQNPVAITSDVLANELLALPRQPTPLPAKPVNLALSAGVLRAGPVEVTANREALRGTLAFDLRDLQVSADWEHALEALPKGWNGPPPRVRFGWRGPVQAPVPSIEATALANGLTALALERESERIQQLEQDQRERSFFNRRLRAAEEEERRVAEARRLRELARQEAEHREQLRLRIESILREAPVPTEPPLDLLPQR